MRHPEHGQVHGPTPWVEVVKSLIDMPKDARMSELTEAVAELGKPSLPMANPTKWTMWLMRSSGVVDCHQVAVGGFTIHAHFWWHSPLSCKTKSQFKNSMLV